MGSDVLAASQLPFPSAWKFANLKSICTKIGSGATPTGGQAAYQEVRTNFVLVRSQNVLDHEFSNNGLAFISDAQAESLKGAKLQANDILLNITGDGATFGRSCLVHESILPACVNQHVCIIRLDPRFANPGYVAGYLSHPAVKSYIESFNAGGSRRAITKGHIESFVVPLPPLKTQVEIGLLLNDFNRRITLLRKTNAILEAIAQALFKSWFVDFDPVRAKVDGRVPEGMDEETAGLFPDNFENTGDALLPKGWKTDTLAGITTSAGGSIQTGPFGSQLHASDYVDDGVPVVMPKDISGRTVSIASIARTTPENVERLARHKLQPGDIVFSRRGDVERHALISETEAGWLCGTGCLLVRPGSSWPSPTFLSMLLDAPAARNWLVQHAVGATMPNLNTGILGSVPVIVPPLSVLQVFEEIVSVLETRRSENLATTQTLASLRDTLLPRLISGQLRLPQAQEEVEEALA